MKKLVLHIEIDVNADNLDELAAIWADDEPVTPRDYLYVVREWMRPEVGITIVTQPDEKCQNSDFAVVCHTGKIVGAEAR